MKKINFDPELELKKVKIMEQFHADNGPDLSLIHISEPTRRS